MKYRWAFDTGTNSLAYVILELDDNNHVIRIVDMGVRIFSDGRNPKDNQPLAMARRMARSIRRQRDRRIQRKNVLVHILTSNGLFPDEASLRQTLKKQDPYRLRKKALDEKLEAYELGRILFQIGSRRGFQSNRLTDQEEKEAGEKLTQAQKITQLDNAIKESGARTLGEYLYQRIVNKQGVRFRADTYECYPSREQYLTEFQAIKEVQQQYYPDLPWDLIEKAIFYQRPLKKPERGKCQFYTSETRAYSDCPSAQQFRIVSTVNNLKYVDQTGVQRPLDADEKNLLIRMLDNCKTLSFNKIRSKLKIDGKFNFEDVRMDKLPGNTIACEMRKPDNFGPVWDQLSAETQDAVVEKLLDAETDEEVLEYLELFNLSHEQNEHILKIKLGKKMGRLSAHFMRDCTKIMKEKHIRYDEAVKEMGLNHSQFDKGAQLDRLPYYGAVLRTTVIGAHPEADDSNPEYKYGKIANPTVHIALNQLRKVVNALIDRYGKPDQVVIELSRDISDSAEKRAEHYRQQSQRERENATYRDVLKKDFGLLRPTAIDLKKYRLWLELGTNNTVRKCPYCGKPISAAELFTNQIDIEHILPYSRTLLDSMTNLTLAHHNCNHYKGSRSPYEAFATSPDRYDWGTIMANIENLPRSKRELFAADAMQAFEENEGFITRQLNDNRYLSTAVREYLSCICPPNQVWTNKGNNTSKLRDNWGFNTILSSSRDPHFKNRSDHRHHALDALVIGLTDRSMLQTMARLNKDDENPMKKVPACPIPRAVITDKLNDIIISYKQDHGHEGRIFKETATGLRKLAVSIKLSELSESDVVSNEKLKAFFEQKRANGISFTKAKNTLMKQFEQHGDKNPEIWILKDIYVTTIPFTSIEKDDLDNERILNKTLRERIGKEVKDVLADKKELKAKLELLSKQWNIKRVRYIPKGQVFTRVASVPNKHYENDGMCCAIIWKIPGKNATSKFQGTFVSYKDIYDHDAGRLKEFPRPKSTDGREIPTAKKIMTLYKGDMIRLIRKDGISYTIVVAGFSTTNNKIDVQPMYCASNIKEWMESTNTNLIQDQVCWNSNVEGHNYMSINVLFNDNQVELLRITPDGRNVHGR